MRAKVVGALNIAISDGFILSQVDGATTVAELAALLDVVLWSPGEAAAERIASQSSGPRKA